jgi:hypothetical protein
MADRIIRGFSRLGIWAAVLVALCGAAVVIADQQSRISNSRIASDRTLKEPIVVKMLNAGGNNASWLEETRIRAEDAAPNLGIIAVLAFATYSFFAVLGWVIAGFVRG